MSFISLEGLGDAREGAVHPEGPVRLRAVSVLGYDKEDTGRHVIKIMHTIMDDDPNANWMPVNHYLAMPLPDDDEGKQRLMLLSTKRYLTAAGVPFESGGFAEDDIEGAEFDIFITQSNPDDNPDGNIYNNLRVPRLADE